MNEREAIRLKRLQGKPWPWTLDPVLQTYRFTNVKRIHDRTTQWVLHNWYDTHRDRPGTEQLLNCALFRYFGTIEFAERVGWCRADGPWAPHVKATAADMQTRGEKVYTGAYIISTGGESGAKHNAIVDRYLLPLHAAAPELVKLARTSRSWQAVAEVMYKLPGFGGTGFMTKEVLQDAMLADVFGGKVVDAASWTPVGPGARRGLNRLYGRPVDAHSRPSECLEQIQYLLKQAPKHVGRHVLALELTAHDIQFVLCECDKYLRVKNGEGRPRAKYIRSDQK
jgi:hypothetical protein